MCAAVVCCGFTRTVRPDETCARGKVTYGALPVRERTRLLLPVRAQLGGKRPCYAGSASEIVQRIQSAAVARCDRGQAALLRSST